MTNLAIPARDLVLFMTATLALNVAPGPDMLYVIARSTREGRRAGVASALGIGAGTLVHIAAVALGLSAVLASVPIAYEIVRWAGAAYLFWLGLTTILQNPKSGTARTVEPASLSKVFWQGVVTNVLNPKVALFFLAFLPQFAGPNDANQVARIVMLGMLFDISGTTVNLIVALSATAISARLRSSGAGSRSERPLRYLVGGIFMAIGARLALARR